MRTSLGELLSRIPGAPNARWPDGNRYAEGLAHGSMSIGLYAPVGADPQQPHLQDEIYIIHAGTGEIVIAGQRQPFSPGDVLFVAAGSEHRFEHFTPGFCAWAVFWGPDGGEA